MAQPSSNDSRVFNLLSLGQRGVGKTVFLAGSYSELSASREANSLGSWIECESQQDREALDRIINYVARTGEYPPATMKISSFNFLLNHRDRRGEREVCKFRWWDIPGEYCNFQQPEFQKMVLDSHSCCLFINAYQLLNDSNYINTLEDLINQIIAIVNLVDLDRVPYRFALVLTQCDRLDEGPIKRLQIEERLHLLTGSLDATDASYERFYGSVIIEPNQENFKLMSSGTSQAFIWLASELTKDPKADSDITLADTLESEEISLDSNDSFFRPYSG